MDTSYTTFYIPKRNGKKRKIEAPNDELKAKQEELLEEFEKDKKLKPSYFTHGFLKGRSIVTCAVPHVGKKFLLRIDIKDFFNSIKYENFTKEMKLQKVSINEEKLMLCFKNDDPQMYDIKKAYLSQGAPTSPYLSNIYLRRFDWAVAWFAFKYKVEYTRYADDLFFSGEDIKDLKIIIQYCRQKLISHKLKANVSKTKIRKWYQRQMVCGIVVNNKINIMRKIRREIRAMIHNAKKDGRELDKQEKGLIAFMKMADPKKFKEIISSVDICNSYAVANEL